MPYLLELWWDFKGIVSCNVGREAVMVYFKHTKCDPMFVDFH